MSGRRRVPLELLLLVAGAIAAVVALRARGGTGDASRRQGELPPLASTPWLRRHESPISPEATRRAEELCATMVEAQVGFAVRQAVTAEVKASYGVGDPESGAGDSLIAEGVARSATGLVSDFRCAMAHIGGYAGDPRITHRERESPR